MVKSLYKFPSFILGEVAKSMGVAGKMEMPLMEDKVKDSYFLEPTVVHVLRNASPLSLHKESYSGQASNDQLRHRNI